MFKGWKEIHFTKMAKKRAHQVQTNRTQQSSVNTSVNESKFLDSEMAALDQEYDLMMDEMVTEFRSVSLKIWRYFD